MHSMVEGACRRARQLGRTPSTAFRGPPPPTGEEKGDMTGDFVIAVDGQLTGTNTDGKGFLRALSEDAKISPAGKNFMILGAGGAARAIAVELALAGAAKISIINRNEERGRKLVELLRSNTKVSAEFLPWSNNLEVPEEVDVLVNATSIGLFPKIDEYPPLNYESIKPGLLVCDVIPNPPQSAFLNKAKARGAVTLDGLGMLVYQGAIAFTLWTGQEAPVLVMKQALAAEFGVE